jgi:hypothetical protein
MSPYKLASRDAAEAIEQFGDDLAALIISLDRLCNRMPPAFVERISGLPNQEHLETIAEAFRALGRELEAEIGAAEEADDRRRSNPLERDFRRIGQ